jgi:hypothetical protein
LEILAQLNKCRPAFKDLQVGSYALDGYMPILHETKQGWDV